MAMARADMIEYLKLITESERRVKTRKFGLFYPEDGVLSYRNYPKHMAFFKAGSRHRERGMMAANRVGKTEGVGCYELTCHLTGKYPFWWEGRRFNRPIKSWAAGTTNQTTKDILQAKLLGPMTDIGTGLIPGDDIVDFKRKASSTPDTVELIYVRHISGGVSVVQFKSYEQGRKSFEGVEQDVILLDEEPSLGIYTECLIRTMTTNGLVLLTFTPLLGVSEVVLLFMPGGQVPKEGTTERFLVGATWDDAPHLTEKDKADLYAALPPHQKDARSKGIPSLGSGAIYPISEEDITVNDFVIPAYWPVAYGFDVGWNATAAVWGAFDRDLNITYLTSCYKRGQAEPPVHVHAIKSRGEWIPGVADPASRASSQRDGEKLMDEYVSLGLHLSKADNSIEAGLFDVYIKMSTGKLKVFKSLAQWFEEYRLYRRDEKGQVVKERDHLMDCTRYLVRSGSSVAQTIPVQLYTQRYGNLTPEPEHNVMSGIGRH